MGFSDNDFAIPLIFAIRSLPSSYFFFPGKDQIPPHHKLVLLTEPDKAVDIVPISTIMQHLDLHLLLQTPVLDLSHPNLFICLLCFICSVLSIQFPESWH